MQKLGITLSSFIIDEQHKLGGSTSSEFTGLLNDISIACKGISNLVNQGDLADVLGVTESENSMGDVQKKMDLIANDMFIDALENNGHCAGMASEELDEVLTLPEGKRRGSYLVTFDPLDGSSNMDINMDVGAIFSVLQAPKGKETKKTQQQIDDEEAEELRRKEREMEEENERRLALEMGFDRDGELKRMGGRVYNFDNEDQTKRTQHYEWLIPVHFKNTDTRGDS